MSVDLRRTQKTICPREPVQMAVFLDVILKGDKEKKSFETWQGKAGASKNDKLEFTDFAFASDQGTFDDDGWFTANQDLRTTIDKELAIKTVYKQRPDKFSFDTKYKPDYGCVVSGGKSGAQGAAGDSGTAGSTGQEGQLAAPGNPGGPASDGQSGRSGGNGADGGDGPHLAIFATMVKTPFYDKLAAIRITGAVADFWLVPIDKTFTVLAQGGSGGDGGNGGSGGRGGRGGAGNPGARGGNGGKGGDGGSGGKGGKGGDVEVTFDAKFPELAQLLKVDVSGGKAGQAGGPGSGGDRGSGGGPIGQGAQGGSDGASGPAGSGGRAGSAGPDGRTSTKPGAVSDKFSGINGLTLLGDASAAAAPAATPDPKKGKAQSGGGAKKGKK
jgi:hypothetical protein